MLLADLGADVIKVEAPGGDVTRGLGPFPPDREGCDYGGYFASVNRNKRSIVLDLRDAGDRDVALRLVDRVDVLVENFRPGVMERLGLGYETLRARRPDLVYAAVRGFGDPRTGESPYGDWPAFDIVAQCMGGVVGTTGEVGSAGLRAGPSVGDIYPGTLAALGVVSALHHVARGGRGQFLDVAMYDGVLALCEAIVYRYAADGTVASPGGNTHPGLCPFEVFATRGGAVAIAAPTDNHWALLCQAIGRPEWADDEDYSSNAARIARADTVREMISAWTGERTTAEVVSALGKRVPVGPVLNAADIFRDPHPRARDMLVEVEQPGANPPLTLAGSPIKLTDTPSGVYRRAPTLGEHGAEILAELGIAAAPAQEDTH